MHISIKYNAVGEVPWYLYNVNNGHGKNCNLQNKIVYLNCSQMEAPNCFLYTE